jgi:hypothetical protein
VATTKCNVLTLKKYSFFLLLGILSSTSWAGDAENRGSRFINDSQQLSKEYVLEFWGYHNYQGNDAYQNTGKLRYYNPLNAGDWEGRLRIDTSRVANFNSTSSPTKEGQYSSGQTMVTVWGRDKVFLKELGALVGGRVIFPFGNNNQWEVGPQLNWSYVPDAQTALPISDFSPLVRYMYGFYAKNNSYEANPSQPPLTRSLYLYPTTGYSLTPNLMLRFWDENGIVYNSAGGGWFVPIDAMLLYRITKNLVLAVGGSKQVVQTYNQYDWSTYAKISLNF